MKSLSLVFLVASLAIFRTAIASDDSHYIQCDFESDAKRFTIDFKLQEDMQEQGTYIDTIPYSRFDKEAKRYLELRARVEFEAKKMISLEEIKEACSAKKPYIQVIKRSAVQMVVSSQSPVFGQGDDSVAKRIQIWAICTDKSYADCK